MKAGGKSLVNLARDRLGPQACWPPVATEILQAAITMTVLRDPVDGASSQLRQPRRADPSVADSTLDEIYDDVWKRAMFISDYQVRQFAKAADDDLFHLAWLEIDGAAMALAQANLARVDMLGLFDRCDEFAVEAVAAFGREPVAFPRWRVSPGRRYQERTAGWSGRGAGP